MDLDEGGIGTNSEGLMTYRTRLVVAAVIAVLVVLVVGRWWAVGTADRLWADALGFAGAHGRIARLRTLLFLAAFVAASVWCVGNLYLIYRSVGSVHVPRRLGNLVITEAIPRYYLSIGFVVVGVVLALALSVDARGWWYARALAGAPTPVGLNDPILQRDASYYLFVLPWNRIVHGYTTVLAAVMFGVSLIVYIAVGAVRMEKRRVHVADGARRHLGMVLAVFALTLVWGYRMEPAEYIAGVHNVPFDSVLVDVRIPTARLLGAVGLMTCIVSLLWIGYRRNVLVFFGWGVLAVLSFVGHYLVPAVAAGVRTDEALRSEVLAVHRADFMQYAYGLNLGADNSLPMPSQSVQPPIGAGDVAAPIVWDEFAVNLLLNRTARQQPYLSFAGAFVEVYRTPSGGHVPVVIGVREVDLNMAKDVDPAFSWERVHLEPYNSSRGAVAVRADLASEQGFPMYIADLRDPDSVVATMVDVALRDSPLLFGASTDEFAIVPEGSAVGVSAGGFGRRVALAWKLQSSPLLTSPAVNRSSIVLWNRSVRQRLNAVAPFADFGAAQPIVVDGRLFWTAFGYVASNTFPLSQRVEWRGNGIGYLRAGFVGVVDAATGETTVHLVPNADPLSAAWADLAPDIVSSWDDLSAALQGRIRYPEELFRRQLHLLRDSEVLRRPGFFGRLRPAPGQISTDVEPFWWLGTAHADSAIRMRLQAVLQTGEPPSLAGLVEGTVGEGGLAFTVQRFDQPWDIPGPYQTVGKFVARRGVDRGVAGPLKMIWVRGGILALQSTYANVDNQDKPPELVSVAVDWGGALGEATTFDSALNELRLSDRPAANLSGDWAAARQWFERLDEARQSGNWAEFGRAYEELKRMLTQGHRPVR